jgi:hypothetical protein
MCDAVFPTFVFSTYDIKNQSGGGLRRMKGTKTAVQHPTHAMNAVGAIRGHYQDHVASLSSEARGEGGEQLTEGDIVPDYESIVKGVWTQGSARTRREGIDCQRQVHA